MHPHDLGAYISVAGGDCRGSPLRMASIAARHGLKIPDFKLTHYQSRRQLDTSFPLASK